MAMTQISEADRAKLLLWCNRHCCFCGKACTTNIEIHHIDEDSSNSDLDNLIPVCFDCHGELPRYNRDHPRGTKYKFHEIKRRREQIYDLYTRDYLRPVDIKISRYLLHFRDEQNQPIKRDWDDVSCSVQLLSQDLPVQLKLSITAYQQDTQLDVELGDLYSGRALWNLNPHFTVHGHFSLPITPDAQPFHFRVELNWTVIDILEREHTMLPISYVWNRPDDDWWFDPRPCPQN